MITLNPINFSGKPPLSKLTPSLERKISFKAENGDTFSLTQSKEEKLQKEFDNIEATKEAEFYQKETYGRDVIYDTHQDIFDSQIKFLKDKFEGEEVSGKFVNENLQNLTRHRVHHLRPGKWKEAIDTVLDNVKQNETNAFSVYKAVAHVTQHTHNIEYVYEYNQRTHETKVRENFPPGEILKVFNRIIKSIKPENTKNLPEQDTSATDVSSSLSCSLGFLPPKNRKHAFDSILGIIDPNDKKYYVTLYRLSSGGPRQLKRQHKLGSVDTIIDRIDPKNPDRGVDAVLHMLGTSWRQEIIERNSFEPEELNPIEEKLDQKIKEREEFLEKSRNINNAE